MKELREVRNVSVSIHRSPADVYAFITDGENIPRWARGLGTRVEKVGDREWLVEGPLGKARVRFAPANDFGVADHEVVLDGGVTVRNPMRVIPNGAGSSLVFTLLRQPGMTAQQLDEDEKAVERDLAGLKALLEAG